MQFGSSADNFNTFMIVLCVSDDLPISERIYVVGSTLVRSEGGTFNAVFSNLLEISESK